MKAKDFRRMAWESLSGKWGTMAVATLIYTLIMGACAALAFVYIGGIATLLLTGAFILGQAVMALSAARRQEVCTAQLFDGFKNYGSSLALYLLIAIFTVLWALLLVIPGIIKAYSYSMSWFILGRKRRAQIFDAIDEGQQMAPVLPAFQLYRLAAPLYSHFGHPDLLDHTLYAYG